MDFLTIGFIGLGFLLLITVVIIFIRLSRVLGPSSQFSSSSKNPYYSLIGGNICYGGKSSQIVQAQISDFRMYDDKNPFGHDKKTVFFKHYPIKGAIPSSFSILEQSGTLYYSADSHHMFINDFCIKDADIKTFRVLAPSEYSVDEYHAYYKGKKIEDADGKTFEILQGSYARDAHHYFLRRTQISVDDIPHNILNDNNITI